MRKTWLDLQFGFTKYQVKSFGVQPKLKFFDKINDAIYYAKFICDKFGYAEIFIAHGIGQYLFKMQKAYNPLITSEKWIKLESKLYSNLHIYVTTNAMLHYQILSGN